MDIEQPPESMTSSQPYLIRGIYDWVIDNGFTPHLLVNAENDEAMIPRDFVENGKIVLNINPSAVSDLQLGNEYIMFSARFNGKSMEISVPIIAVLAIYAKENGQGMMFDETTGSLPPTPPETPIPEKKSKRPQLKVVK